MITMDILPSTIKNIINNIAAKISNIKIPKRAHPRKIFKRGAPKPPIIPKNNVAPFPQRPFEPLMNNKS